MTTKRDLKQLIRDRMKKTGESYASARRAVLGESSAPRQGEAREAGRSTTAEGAIPGWIVTGQAPSDYEFKLDEHGYRSRSSAMVRAKREQPAGFGTLTQRFIPKDHRGRRVRLSGWIKSEGVTGSAKLWMRVEMPDQRVVSFGQSPLITGTTDWAQYHVVLDVDQDAAILAFGILLENGAGTAWLSDVSLENVGNDVATSDLINKPLPDQPRNLSFQEGVRPEGSAVDELCRRLQRDSNALSVTLLDKYGVPIAHAGDDSLLDADAVRAFCESSNSAIADLAANRELAGHLHHPANTHLHVSLVGNRAILAVLFDNRSSLGLVRLRAKKASEHILRMLSDPTGSSGSAPATPPTGSSGSPAPAQVDDRDEELN